ncbi:MAG TPA: lipopolysaccharide biosynthesis protein [Afipia sp.]|uniref:GumC family protein n=1 Tax=unclassified Afipia TaxID=2642050 RepID=UPI0004655EC4|nr:MULTISPECIES: exopolysaccharide transport family protein [unclassified Afipia]MAH69873.1 lipopolysaccharide biosynthesis protein [Afipia sp.]OUX60786.1 MAG: lipopolysaccharide biosynthesis protein [Afipia sp. TMED4]HAO42525.1 lipopolysaccharide biosynthesis protein [Afipia sp.]HAP11154.1 lipopolysaccharide biosynthesis protein [Afipia sp.]HAP49575.1 lipopolysaccharide biosynthesis protein [Afipia sp.]
MRFSFWRDWMDKLPFRAKVDAVPIAAAHAPAVPVASPELGDVDLRAIWDTLVRKRMWVIGPTVLAFVLSLLVVNIITPRYKSEARILIDGRENIFLRPNGDRAEERGSLDAEAVTSQVQLLLSRELARDVIKANKLSELPEFDPVLRGVSPLRTLLALFGIVRDPFKMTPEERVLEAYYERLTAYAVDKSRVMVIEFQSQNPELAARVTNSIADGYLVLQQAARQNQAKSASQWLLVEIESLRKKVADAEAKVEEFRSKSNLFVGTNNTTLSNQQLGELNTQLNNARALKSDAESKSRLIREMLQSGKPIEASEVLNSELVRRLSEQRVTLRAQLAEQSSTLLGGHPRIKELKAQILDIDRQIREEASKISRSLENDARIASARADGLNGSLDQLKRQASSTNGQDVQLRALEREAKAQRDLLESYLAKYREATTRENIDTAPADGRIISRAIVSNTPAFPKKLPTVLIATLAMLMLSAGYITTGELLRMTAPRPGVTVRAPVAAPRDTPPQVPTGIVEIERLVAMLRGGAARKITVIGAHQDESVTLVALTLARLLSRNSKVVLVDLAMASPTLAAVSTDPASPGLTELMQGSASFSDIITKDRLSAVHIVGAGRDAAQRQLLQLPRINLAIDALSRAYDYVVLDAGTASDLPATVIAAQAHAVIIPDPAITAAAREMMKTQLLESGFAGVTILTTSLNPMDLGAPGQRVAAA